MGMYLFRTPRPNRFNHTPIYYDEAKEDLETLKRNATYTKSGAANTDFKPSLKGQFKKNRMNTSLEYGIEQRKKSNYRLLGVIVFLLFVGYLILQSSGEILAVLLSK